MPQNSKKKITKRHPECSKRPKIAQHIPDMPLNGSSPLKMPKTTKNAAKQPRNRTAQNYEKGPKLVQNPQKRAQQILNQPKNANIGLFGEETLSSTSLPFGQFFSLLHSNFTSVPKVSMTKRHNAEMTKQRKEEKNKKKKENKPIR